MQRHFVFALLLGGALAAMIPVAALAARTATDTTPVLPASGTMMRTFRADSAALPESLSYLETVALCGSPPCDGSHPLCAGDSLTVRLSGHLPSSCFSIRKIAIYYPPIVSIRPFAPWVVVSVDDGACLDRPCIPERWEWHGGVVLPPLPPGPYSLDVAVVRVSCADSLPAPTSITRTMPFNVASCDSQPPPEQCLVATWVHPGDPTVCDATITPGGDTQVTFGVQSAVPLSGLQGEFTVAPSTLKITGFELTGNAYGYRFGWSPTATGIRWFLFNDGGAPIPSGPPLKPLFNVTLHAPAGEPVPVETYIFAENLLGSDPSGNAVPTCPPPSDTSPQPRYAPPFARICGTAACDANNDGHTDVRDLVMMVNCLHGGVACATSYDCDHNGTFTLDDVLCCAWKILRVRPCLPPETCDPDSTPPRKDANVRVTSGVPVEHGNEMHLPVHIEGAAHVGAARLAMRFPSDRWRILGVESNDPAWLTLVDSEQGEAIIGAIRIGGAIPRGAAAASATIGDLELTLRLEPLNGPASGGELGAISADLSATDGVRLIAPVVAPVRPLPGSPYVELSKNRPEPFTGETRFTLSLPVSGNVELGVFDLSGRRVATLHHGALKAGVTEFAWNGHADSGAQLGAGVYFYRAGTAQGSVSRRMVYLGGR